MEHLNFHCWYLKKKQFIKQINNTRRISYCCPFYSDFPVGQGLIGFVCFALQGGYNEPHHEKTFFVYAKTKVQINRAVTAQLISAFASAT